MFYYTVKSSHWWSRDLEFKSMLELKEGQYFRITRHDGFRQYPTRFKVLAVSELPKFSGDTVEILGIETNVEPF